MKFKFLLFIFITFLFYNCKSTATVAEINNLKEVVANKNFEVTFDSAIPVAFANVRGLQNLLPPGSNQSFINLVGNPNHFIVKSDSLQVNLPYFGEAQIASGYSMEDGGILFEGIPKKITEKFDVEKNTYTFSYDLKTKKEFLRATLKLFANKKSTLNVNSSNRTTISYEGTWKNLKME